MHKRILSAVALGAVATLALAGCAGGTDPPPPTARARSSPSGS